MSDKPCCWTHASTNQRISLMFTCTVCGNKRCPKATDHELPCTGSNESGQPGSRFKAEQMSFHEIPGTVMTISKPDDPNSWSTIEPEPFSISFYDGQDMVGELSYDNEGQLTFSGKAHNSAEVFFEQVCKANNKELERLDRLEHMLHEVRSWCAAYPLAVFPEPDWGDMRQKLGDSQLTRLSASNMRHVIEGVERILNQCEKDST